MTERLMQASLGGLASFALFFIVNLMNPRWMAFGDVRLSLVFGFGLAWVSPIAPLPGLPLRQPVWLSWLAGPHRRSSGQPQVGAALRSLHGSGRPLWSC